MNTPNICPKCKWSLPDHGKFCPNCGVNITSLQPAPGLKPCPYCAEYVQEEAILCRYCGRMVSPEPLRKRKKIDITALLIIMFFELIIIGIAFLAWDSISTTPFQTPTRTPRSTYPPLLTATLNPLKTDLPTEPAGGYHPIDPECFLWSDITSRHLGQNLCVYGEIHAYDHPPWGGTRIYFDTIRNFYMVSPDFYWSDLTKGKCAIGKGTVEESTEGKLFINVKGALYYCE